jgi:hypothetical protein
MKRVLLLAPAVLLSLSSCTSGVQVGLDPAFAPNATSATPGSGNGTGATTDTVLAQAEEGQDLGNGRPAVSYDGLMVRRRVVIAVHSRLDADLVGIRRKLDAAAAAQGLTLADISPDVLEPAELQHLMPELTVLLPTTATLDDGQALVTRTTGDETQKLGAEHFHVLPVLVHDLSFTIGATNPTRLSAAIDREGILSDAFGNYRTTRGIGKLSFSYTGPLLADETVESVRSGISRQAHVAASYVTVTPRSPAGTGVDMATEAPWDPEVTEQKKGHTHG